MSKSANLPAPYKGINEQVPVAALQSPNCETLINFNSDPSGISLRHGDSIYKSITTANLLQDYKIFAPYGDTSLFVQVWDRVSNAVKIYDVASGSLVYTSAVGTYYEFQYQYFNKYIYLFTSLGIYAPGIVYDGATWGTIGYTGASTFAPIGGGNAYKNRNYIVARDEAAYWYSGIDAVTGVLTKVDLSSVVSEKCTLANIASITLSDQVSINMLQAFCFSNGEILFYQGAYPDSDSWELVGRAKVGQLVSQYDSVFSYQGDAIILSDNGVASLRDLFLKGSLNAFNFSINKRIQKTWANLIKAMRVFTAIPSGPISARVSGIWDSTNSRIIIYLPSSLINGVFDFTSNTFFIYDTITEAWHIHYSQNGAIEFCDTVFYRGKVLLLNLLKGGVGVFLPDIQITEKEGGSGFTDRSVDNTTDVPFDYEMLSAPIPFPKTAVYQTSGIEPILESDLYTQTNWTFVSDFGKQTTNNQNISDTMATTVSKPLLDTAIQNITYVQVKMAGTTVASKTVGLNLYSFNVWYDNGEEGSR